jgi:hypothetical protein
MNVTLLSQQEIERIIDERIAERLQERKKVYPEFISVDELAKMVQRSKNTVHRWCCYNYEQIPFQKNGARLMFQREEITQWAKSMGMLKNLAD